jgi:FkbM family methyltransferase
MRITLNKSITRLVKSTLKHFGIGIIRYTSLQRLRENETASDDINMLFTLPNEDASQIIKYLPMSQSQIRQDLFALSELNFKKNGYFVEFGATDGIYLSNTYLMEKELGWEGIIAEPAPCWHQDLMKNRSCHIEHKCVWMDSSSILTFNEADMPGLSTINSYSSNDGYNKERKKGKVYDVETISLTDLLIKYNAPTKIDYLSIDTEGSELEILKHFDFNRYSFNVITCEHNFTSIRESIYELLSGHGYVRKFQELSKFDDWYIKSK